MSIAWFFLCATGISLVTQLIAVWASRRHLARARRATTAPLPSLSLLKPIKGLEEGLEANLRSFYEQAYPGTFEVVFAAMSMDDLGVLVAERVAAQYPKVQTRFVRADPSFGLNPKVATLKAAYDAARFDLVFQSDANVRVHRDYLAQVVRELEDERAHLLSSVVIGSGERSLGAAFENLQLTAFIAPGMCAALYGAKLPCVVGKSMLFRRSELEAVGGLESVRDILCEDFILGRAYREHGYKVVLSPVTVTNVNEEISVERFLARHSRWLKLRAVIHWVGFVADLLSNPVALTFFAWVASGFQTGFGTLLLATAAFKTVLDSYYVHLFRGTPVRASLLVFAPIKDILMGLVWCYAVFSRSVRWRGRKLRFGKDSVLYADSRNVVVRMLGHLGIDAS